MTQIQTDAIRKLTEAKHDGLDDMQKYLAPHVVKTCVQFCEQSEEFATAVMAEDKTLVGCLKAMTLPGRGMGYCSDFDVYRMAAQYFFPEADVEWSMKISVPRKSQTSAKILDLRFEDLFKMGGGK
ncbi:MAG: hypothetical protein IJX39_04605 [Clostridia bacterium]|nr:hypothetical protein [Clostridia bacterium]MBQ8357070.1 hypothetical protein [Clostridia bacterium]